MTGLNLPAIRYSRRQLALMIRAAELFDPNFPDSIQEPKQAIGLLADLVREGAGPSGSVLAYFGIQRSGREFVWIPR